MKLKYLGKNIQGTVNSISSRLDVSKEDVEDLSSNSTRYLYNKRTGDISRVNIKESPLMIRDFGVKRINNNKLIKGGEIKKNINVLKNHITLNKKITGYITCKIIVVWVSSGNMYIKEFIDNTEERVGNLAGALMKKGESTSYHKEGPIEITKQKLGSEQDLKDQLIEDFMEQHPVIANDVINEVASINVIDLKFISKNRVKFDFSNMLLRGKPLNISKIFGENVILNNTNDDNCVRNYLLNNYKKISKNTINNIGSKDGVTPDQMYKFCTNYNIKMVIFNIEGNVIKSYYPTKRNKTYKKLIGVAYNNHFYPLKNKELHRIPLKKISKNIYSENLYDTLDTLLNNNECPNNISLYNDEISSILIDDTLYHVNKDYNFCYVILDKLGLGDKMEAFINRINISKVIEKLFIESSVESYFPYSSNEGGYSYFNEGFIDDEDDITIDHNKHYSDSLRKLEDLIVIDIKTAIHEMNPKELKRDFFYIAKPKYSSILMPKTGFYSYDFLIYCKNEGVEFELKESISCIYKKNYFNTMINTLYEKLTNEEFKDVVNCMIGRFEKKGEKSKKLKFIKIANKDETERSDYYVKKINDEYNLLYEVEDDINTKINNRVPIRVQALCEARKIVYEKMKELNLKRDDIKQIRTDAITFKKKDYKHNTDKKLGGWKEQSKEDTTFYKKETSVYESELTFKLKSMNEKNTIYIDYAGSGKTHYIINKLIPLLERCDRDYIVLSPSHASIKDYRKQNINCNVIQKYIFSGKIPTEKNIIIDEVGMLDTLSNNILIKAGLLGKNIYSFGDFKQLKPVNSDICNSDIYLNYLYNNIKSLGTNYRNDFSKEYYDELINMTDNTKIKNEILKYNTKNYFDAECIITYTNESRIKYNKLMIERLNLEFGDVGCRIVCKSNNLSDKNIYNNFYYTIKEVDEDEEEIIITDEIDDIRINKKDLDKYFDLGYCRTLYNIQGESIKSFYYAMEDIRFIDGRSLYTLISRIKNI
jgi:hypothetical protein